MVEYPLYSYYESGIEGSKGRHMATEVRYSELGRVDLTIRVWNRVALAGFRGKAQVIFLSGKSNVIDGLMSTHIGVDGRYIPLAGLSDRTIMQTHIVPEGVWNQVTHVGIRHYPAEGPTALDRGLRWVSEHVGEIGKVVRLVLPDVLSRAGFRVGNNSPRLETPDNRPLRYDDDGNPIPIDG